MQQKKALVVDNEKVMVEMLSKILKKEGFDVDKAYGGLEALTKLKQQQFDVVFLDMVMPWVGGDRICKFIKQSPGHRETKVVIVSACAIEAEQQLFECKADACIAKAAFSKLKENIIKALKLLEDKDQKSNEMILGKEGIHDRTVVKELLFAQRYSDAILNSMREGVIELDTDNIITYVNLAAQTILGKKEWELIGVNFAGGFDAERAKEIESLLNELTKTSGSMTKDLIYKSSGDNREFSLSFTNVTRDGELVGATVVLNDITEKKLLEKERFLRERLAGVMEMAATAAHELNQPLAVISGNSELLLRDSEKYDDKLCSRIKSILDQVDRLGALTKKFAGIVAYETKEYAGNIKIVDIEKSSRTDDKIELKGLWE